MRNRIFSIGGRIIQPEVLVLFEGVRKYPFLAKGGRQFISLILSIACPTSIVPFQGWNLLITCILVQKSFTELPECR